MLLTRSVRTGGMDLTFIEEPGAGRPFQIAARAASQPAATLSAVLSTVWIYSDGPEGLLSQIDGQEGGQGWEEAAGWERVDGGPVRVTYLKDEFEVPHSDFLAAAKAMCRFHLEVAALRAVHGPQERAIQAWLERTG